MSVPGVVVPDLVLVQPGLVLAGLEGLLDRPAGSGDADELAHRVRAGPAQRQNASAGAVSGVVIGRAGAASVPTRRAARPGRG